MILNKEHIIILYDNEQKTIEIVLNQKERIILCFLKKLKIDITIVEIIPKDGINDPSYFLSPYIDNDNDNDNFNPYKFVKKNIEIIQYPKGGELSHSKGVILGIYPKNDNIFIHNSNTKKGSSGSPIILSGEQTVFAIHKGVYIEIKENVGIFIEGVVKFLKNFKKNGEGIEYYENGMIKYKGNFLDDEYNGEGIFYYPNGEFYVGQFIKGLKIGDGKEYYKNGKIKYTREYENNNISLRQYNRNSFGLEIRQKKTIIKINDILKMAKGVVQIHFSYIINTGFFIKLERNKKPFYCLMTNQHVITPEMINREEIIEISYKNGEKILKLKLNKKERTIICFEEINNSDITLVEIIQNDEIDESYFLNPYIKSNEEIIDKKIKLIHFPRGKEISSSTGKILEINNKNKNEFFHDAITLVGSGGAPIFIEGDVIGIHKGKIGRDKKKNIGVFIKDVIDYIKNY